MEERYSEVYCEYDRSDIDAKKNTDDIIGTLIQTCFWHETGSVISMQRKILMILLTYSSKHVSGMNQEMRHAAEFLNRGLEAL